MDPNYFLVLHSSWTSSSLIQQHTRRLRRRVRFTRFIMEPRRSKGRQYRHSVSAAAVSHSSIEPRGIATTTAFLLITARLVYIYADFAFRLELALPCLPLFFFFSYLVLYISFILYVYCQCSPKLSPYAACGGLPVHPVREGRYPRSLLIVTPALIDNPHLQIFSLPPPNLRFCSFSFEMRNR
jgi:hypothetical protein